MRLVVVLAGGGLGEGRRCFGWLCEVVGEPGELVAEGVGGMAHCGARISRRGARWQQWRLRLVWVCLLLKWNGEELAQLNEGRGARVCSRWLGRNARRREAQRGGACSSGRRRVPRRGGDGTSRGGLGKLAGDAFTRVRQLQRRGQPTGRHSSARQGRGEGERAAKRRVDGRATANRLACGSHGLEEGTAGRVRLGERREIRRNESETSVPLGPSF